MNNLKFDFIIDKENKNIAIKKEFAADVSSVWDAFTKSKILDLWWAPKPWKSKTKSMEFKEGGRRLYAMVGPAGEEHWAIFNFKEIEKPKYFTGLDGFTDANGVLNTEMPQSNWKVSFIDKGKTTLVDILISFDKLENLETTIQMGFKEGMTMTLEELDEILPEIFKK